MSLSATALREAILSELAEELGDPGDSGEIWDGIARAVAQAVVQHLQDDGEIRVTITTSDGALQQFDAGRGPVDTDPPSSARQLDGVIL